MDEPISVPNYNEIFRMCASKLIQKHEEYGNSWVKEHDREFWLERLQGEVTEINKMTETLKQLDPDLSKSFIFQLKNELADVINICSMIYSNLGRY